MCSIDYERCAAWSERMRVARKAHRCNGCEATIQIKEPYLYVSGVFERQGWSECLCFACWWDWERYGEAHDLKPMPSGLRDALTECADDETWRPALAALIQRNRSRGRTGEPLRERHREALGQRGRMEEGSGIMKTKVIVTLRGETGG